MGRITDDGEEFSSVLDGSKQLITPERAIAIQFDLGTDMMTVQSGAGVVRASMLLTNPFDHSSVLLRRSVLLEHGLRYPAGQPAAIDYDLWLQCARVTEIDNIPRPLAYYRRNPAGITSRHGNYANQRLLAGVGRELARLLPDVEFGAGTKALRFRAPCSS